MQEVLSETMLVCRYSTRIQQGMLLVLAEQVERVPMVERGTHLLRVSRALLGAWV
jgi:hypothetical protein